MQRTAIIAEVKRNKNKLNLSALQEKLTTIKPSLFNFKIELKGLSIEDM